MAIIRTATAAAAERSAIELAGLGVRMLEVSLVVPGALSVIRSVRESLPAEVQIGAGTVLTNDDARSALDHGAGFLVAPGFDAGVASVALDAGAGFYPGAATATEILAAWNGGATAVKLFPAGALGPAYLRALRDPLPEIPLLAVGGVTVTDIPAFFAAGSIGVGLGSVLQGDRMRDALDAVAAARSNR